MVYILCGVWFIFHEVYGSYFTRATVPALVRAPAAPAGLGLEFYISCFIVQGERFGIQGLGCRVTAPALVRAPPAPEGFKVNGL